jgi:class 3 adenylate cyclase/tetratricopeptide (TPR) repeat protein
MPVCGRCGENNPERARFCLGCAAPLAAPALPRREERKVVSVLFCDLVGFTSRSERLDIEDVRALLAPYYQRLRAELERFGGTVEKFIGDAVMALFGAPTAHEDDPERAVRAALAIREAMAEFNQADPALDLHVRVGVTTGEALVVLDARPVEGEAMASGDVVNTAARLQTAAPVDGILVDDGTFRATERTIEYRQAEPVAAKGKTDPVKVWQALAARASLGVDVAQAPRTSLVGRDWELGLLADALARSRTEQTPQLVTLLGVPGLGKSRLVFELLQLVETGPELTIWRQGRCLPYGEGVALWALGEIVKAQAGILESDAAESAEAKLTRAVADVIADGQEAAWVTIHLRPLVGLESARELGSERQGEAFAGWRRFLEALAEQSPTVLVVEDLHWADEVLLEFLDHLVDWAADVPLLVVATARPELLARRPGWGGGKLNSVTVSLTPLSEADTARLVGRLLGQALLPAELQAALLARAGGNPLYAEEYVRMLADQGFLRRVGGTWQLGRAEELPLPETVQGIIAARLDTLAAEDKALVQDAAVLGKVGWLGALVALGDAEPAALEPRLHALERRELLRRERRSAVAGERQYAFRHVLVRDVAYAQLPRAARAAKHQRVARWLEALSPDRAEDRAEQLAHHWQAALEYARAVGQETAELVTRTRLALRDAGEHALAVNAYGAAARWYTAALELCHPSDALYPSLLLQLGKAQFYGELSGAEVLVGARDAVLAAGDQEAAAEAERMLGELSWLRGRREEAFQHQRRAVSLLEGAEPSRAKAAALVTMAALLWLAGESEDAVQIGREGLAIAELVGHNDMRVLALEVLGGARLNLGDLEGLADYERAVAVGVAVNTPETSRAQTNLASVLYQLGNLARADSLIAAGRQTAERFGLAKDLRWLEPSQIDMDYRGGRWDAALRAADQFIGGSAEGASHYLEPNCRIMRGLIRLGRGELAAAVEDADKALAFARIAKDPQVLWPSLAFRARALLASGSLEEADRQASELLTGLREDPWTISVEWLPDLAIVLEQLGRGDQLLEVATRAKLRTPWLEAASAFACGDPEGAAAIYARIGARPDEAFARLRAAERLLAAGRPVEAGAQGKLAMAFHREAGATAYLRASEVLLAESA